MKLKTIFESVYNEFGKLGSLEEKLSPKLKALLAAGLIGTASLGMQSCAQPTDDGTYPPIELTDNKTPADDTKKGDNTAVEKYPVCKQLGIDDTLREKMTGAKLSVHAPFYQENEKLDNSGRPVQGFILKDKELIKLSDGNAVNYATFTEAYMLTKVIEEIRYNYFILDSIDSEQLSKLKNELNLQESKSMTRTNK